MLQMISTSKPSKLHRIQQTKDTKLLLNFLQNNSVTDDENDFITKFKTEYSEIALKRVINYHFDNCIQSFLLDPANKNPCVINDSKRIIDSFIQKFPLFNGLFYTKKLIDSIQWNTTLLHVSNISLIDPLLIENCKEAVLNILESCIAEVIESIGICTFDQLISNESILILKSRFDFDFETILLSQYIKFM